MAYVPLHKRHWKEGEGPSRVPASLAWRVKKGLNSRSPETNAHQSGRIEYADTAIPRWSRKALTPHERQWKEGEGPSCVPASLAWRVKKGLNSRSPVTNAHQSGRIEYADTAIPGCSRKALTPHERHWKERDDPSRVPASLAWWVKEGLNLRSPKTNAHQSGWIEYADTAISRWLAVGLDDDGDHLPSTVFLKPVSVEATEWRSGDKLLALAKSCIVDKDDETGLDHRKKPWVHITETVMQDLICSFEGLRSEIKDQTIGEIKPTMIARFGKILFHGTPSFPVETCGDMVTEASLKRLKRTFYANLPSFYMENVTHKVIPEIGLSLEDEKEIYLVKLSDKSRPGATICCKCRVLKPEQRLELYKIELGQVRHLVVDVSCLDEDLDMRLMLRNKRFFTAISENEKNSIRDLVTSAVLDSNVKGGLRWPLEKASSGDRYSVIGVWHTISTSYKNSLMRLKVRHADRFDLRISHGEVTEEITLKLNGISSKLHGQSLETNSISDMLKDAIKMIWEHFLSCGNQSFEFASPLQCARAHCENVNEIDGDCMSLSSEDV